MSDWEIELFQAAFEYWNMIGQERKAGGIWLGRWQIIPGINAFEK